MQFGKQHAVSNSGHSRVCLYCLWIMDASVSSHDPFFPYYHRLRSLILLRTHLFKQDSARESHGGFVGTRSGIFLRFSVTAFDSHLRLQLPNPAMPFWVIRLEHPANPRKPLEISATPPPEPNQTSQGLRKRPFSSYILWATRPVADSRSAPIMHAGVIPQRQQER